MKGTIKCCRCGKTVSVEAHPMIAIQTQRGIEHTSHPRPDDKIVPSDRKLYWYDVNCPHCGANNESVVG